MSLDRDLSEHKPNFEEVPDHHLLTAAKKGDRDARNTLYLRYYIRIGAMVGRAKRIVALASDTDRSIESEDVVQQTFLIFCDLLDNWTPAHGPFVTYLARLLPSQANHFVRDALHHRAKARVVNAQDTGREHDQFERSMEQQVHSNLLWAEHTRNLQDPTRRWITLRYNYGLTTSQIATLSGLSPRTVDRQLRAYPNN